MAELQEVDALLDALLAGLEPAARKRMMRELAQHLRRAQKKYQDAAQPGRQAYEPRRVTARTKQGRIRRQMFAKLRTTKYLKAVASPDSASVEFEGRVQRIARVHHYGLRDRVSRKGPEVQYSQRRLLGINDEVEDITRDTFCAGCSRDFVSGMTQPAALPHSSARGKSCPHECSINRNYAPYHQSDPHRHRDRSGPGRLAVPGENR
ncbi:phage virion morphogenesis protein [Raoultella planticola]|nr:phage virion morphogenesis protein [Raoultella planticola]